MSVAPAPDPAGLHENQFRVSADQVSLSSLLLTGLSPGLWHVLDQVILASPVLLILSEEEVVAPDLDTRVVFEEGVWDTQLKGDLSTRGMYLES